MPIQSTSTNSTAFNLTVLETAKKRTQYHRDESKNCLNLIYKITIISIGALVGIASLAAFFPAITLKFASELLIALGSVSVLPIIALGIKSAFHEVAIDEYSVQESKVAAALVPGELASSALEKIAKFALPLIALDVIANIAKMLIV